MTTRTISQRFTAEAALHFLENRVSEVDDNDLRKPFHERKRFFPYDVYDRWQCVPADFARRWAAYREPPIPLTTKLLRWICSFRRAGQIVRTLRKFMAVLYALFFRIFSSLHTL